MLKDIYWKINRNCWLRQGNMKRSSKEERDLDPEVERRLAAIRNRDLEELQAEHIAK